MAPKKDSGAELKKALQGKLSALLEVRLDTHHAAHGLPVENGRRRTGKSSYTLTNKLRMYSGSLAVVARSGVGGLAPDGWMLLLRSVLGLPAQVELHRGQGEYKIVRVTTGGLAEELARKAGWVATPRDSRRKSKAPDLRVLSVPGMHFLALWIHHPGKENLDSFLPVMKNFVGLHRRSKYGQAAVDRALRRGAMELILRWYERGQNTMAGQRKDRTIPT